MIDTITLEIEEDISIQIEEEEAEAATAEEQVVEVEANPEKEELARACHNRLLKVTSSFLLLILVKYFIIMPI